ncbi:MAG: AAA family ATPase [Chloroflexi bacterium]|nr:AAA family ATPase [Chloroflexota bacterium]
MTTHSRELERSIDQWMDGFGNWVATRFRWIFVIFALLAFFVLFMIPTWEAWLPWAFQGAGLLLGLFYAILFIIIQFGALFWVLGRGRTYWVMPGETGVSFEDYKGNPEILESARRIVTLLRGAKEFKDMGGEAVRGLLLVGPPGTGKSYLAQCISTEAMVPFGYASAPSFQNMFMGVGNLRVMMLYGKARKLARKYGACILFIDEIDAIGMSRGGQAPGMMMGMMGMGGGTGLINELLLQMDPPPQDTWKHRMLRKVGLRKKKAERETVLTMAATNLAESLDQALLRPGRFDRKLVVDHPDAEGRREIIEYYLAKVRHDEMPMEKMISDTIGYTPVSIKHVINQAAVQAHFDGRNSITYRDWRMALETHEWGLRQPIKGMNKDEKRRLAYHEAGHALAQIKLQPHMRFAKVTIIRHGTALGLSANKPMEERYTETREELLAEMQICLASRASEELFLGTGLTGVSSDLNHATLVAQYYIGVYGMADTLVSQLALGPTGTPDVSKIDKMLKDQFQRVKSFLWANRDTVHAIAQGLLEHEELDEDQVIEIIAQAERNRAGDGEEYLYDRTLGFLAASRRAHVLVETNGHPNHANGNGHHDVSETAVVEAPTLPPAEAPAPAVNSGEAGDRREAGPSTG